MSDLYYAAYNPDVLSCLANLSNDEVFTPPEVANAMLDMLPQELFSNPRTTFLDPGTKSGVFLREIVKRLLVGLEKQMPDLQTRLDHIMHNQVFGIAITEMTSMLARRSVYCSKYPNSKYSISFFDDIQGNVRYKNTQHVWQNGKCAWCNASEAEYGSRKRSDDLETHAYEFIHTKKLEELFGMKFDVIIGNPPYQLSDGGAQASAKPIYNLFIDQAKRLNPRYLVMIVPARWYAGGKGLDAFRDNMLSDKHMRELHDFPITSDCFPGVNIRGGVCYFLWDRSYDNSTDLTKVVTHDGKETHEIMRTLKYKDLSIFIRRGEALTILNKVSEKCGDDVLAKIVSSRKPFGLSTDYAKSDRFHEKKRFLKNPVACIGKGKTVGYIEKGDIEAHIEWLNHFKVFVPRANNIGTELNDDNLNAFIGEPGYVCTESYIVIGGDLDLSYKETDNLTKYMQTKFVRFLHSLAKSSQDATSKTYRFVPMQDFTKAWTDDELYEKYGLSEEEIEFIENSIKEMQS